jgi:hypothetical protein
MHACTLEPGFHHHLVSTFHAARADRPACRQKGGVLHLSLALLQIGQLVTEPFHLGVPGDQGPHVGQHLAGTLVLEFMQLRAQPVVPQLAARLPGRLRYLAQMLGSMREIQDAHCIGPMVIDQARQPLRSILHRTHLRRLF